jgi:hypothetical protein
VEESDAGVGGEKTEQVLWCVLSSKAEVQAAAVGWGERRARTLKDSVLLYLFTNDSSRLRRIKYRRGSVSPWAGLVGRPVAGDPRAFMRHGRHPGLRPCTPTSPGPGHGAEAERTWDVMPNNKLATQVTDIGFALLVCLSYGCLHDASIVDLRVEMAHMTGSNWRPTTPRCRPDGRLLGTLSAHTGLRQNDCQAVLDLWNEHPVLLVLDRGKPLEQW